MRRLGWKSWTKNDDGNVGMIFAAMLIPTVMLIGGSVDYGDAINKKSLLQNAADAATLAAAKLDDAEANDIITMAKEVFAAKLEGTSLEGLTPTVAFSNNQVILTVGADVPTAFMKIANIDNLQIDVRSAAQKGQEGSEEVSAAWGNICLLALDRSASVGIDVQGSKVAQLGTCWAYSNSDSAYSVDSTGNSYTFNSGGVCAAALLADDAVPSNQDHFNPSIREGCEQVDDPFADTSAYPSAASWNPTFDIPSYDPDHQCIRDGLRLRRGTYTLNAGTYCNGLEIQANAVVTLNSGVYIVDKAPLTIKSGANVTGNNVVFFLTGSGGKLDVQGGANLSLVGRHAGQSYEGFVIIQLATANQGAESQMIGGGTLNVEGVVYLPTQQLTMGGNGNMNGTSRYFIAVAKKLYIYGSGTLKIVDHQSTSPLPNITPPMPDLESQTTRLVE